MKRRLRAWYQALARPVYGLGDMYIILIAWWAADAFTRYLPPWQVIAGAAAFIVVASVTGAQLARRARRSDIRPYAHAQYIARMILNDGYQRAECPPKCNWAPGHDHLTSPAGTPVLVRIAHDR